MMTYRERFNALVDDVNTTTFGGYSVNRGTILWAAAVIEAARKMHTAAQGVLSRQIIPDGISDHEALNELPGILDGPLWRAYRDALEGEPESK